MIISALKTLSKATAFFFRPCSDYKPCYTIFVALAVSATQTVKIAARKCGDSTSEGVINLYYKHLRLAMPYNRVKLTSQKHNGSFQKHKLSAVSQIADDTAKRSTTRHRGIPKLNA